MDRSMLMDVIPHVLWDSIISPGVLFRVPLGQGESVWGAGAKTLADTNMDLGEQLPEGWVFKIKEMRAEAVPPTDPRDLIGVVLRFVIASKIYVQTPADQAAVHWRIQETPGMVFPWFEYGINFASHPLTVNKERIAVLVDGRPGRALRVSLHGQLSRPCQ
jgi:hypothetical protein